MTPRTRDDEPISSHEARNLARESVAIWKEMVGRGATFASAYGNPGSVSLVFREVLTQSERTLVSDGRTDHVRDHRRALFESTRSRMIEAMERSSEAPVEALLYDVDPEHDTCAFTFVFAQPGSAE